MFPFKKIRSNRDGLAITEFALIAPVLFMALLGIFDMGHRAYLNSVLYGAVQKAGRDSSLETGLAQQAAIKAKIEAQITPILLGSTVVITRVATKSFTAVAAGEPFTDGNGNGTRDAPECFDDENGDGVWNAVAGTTGLGGTDDVVTYKATVNFAHIFPFPSLIGASSNDRIVATTVLRNQPYGDDTAIRRICT
jgi:Flp pilus assembly protein TadG